MSEEQRDRFVSKGLGLLAINAPGVRCNIPSGALLLSCVAGGSLREPERAELSAWIENEPHHSSSWLCNSLPPFPILKCTDLLNKLWGWDRLLAYDLYCEFKNPSDMAIYESYLEKFYASDHHGKKVADAILQCLEKEEALSTEWNAKRVKVFPFNMGLSKDIQECMSNLVKDAGSESRQPFATYAAACISKEAELMIEWLSQGSDVPIEEYNTSNEIRQWALDLAMFEGNWDTHIAALLLGITKEARSLLESTSLGCLVSTDISMRIRTYGLQFLIHKLDEFELDAEPTLGVSDEMTSATEINQVTWSNTESVSFGKNEMQERCLSKKITDLENITGEGYPIILRRPNGVDEDGAY